MLFAVAFTNLGQYKANLPLPTLPEEGIAQAPMLFLDP
jgi:hypothetical protein